MVRRNEIRDADSDLIDIHEFIEKMAADDIKELYLKCSRRIVAVENLGTKEEKQRYAQEVANEISTMEGYYSHTYFSLLKTNKLTENQVDKLQEALKDEAIKTIVHSVLFYKQINQEHSSNNMILSSVKIQFSYICHPNSLNLKHVYLPTEVVVSVLVVLQVVSGYPYPGDDASTEDLVKYYFCCLYTTREICGFLMLCHGIFVSMSTIERIKRRLGLRRRQNHSPRFLVQEMILELRSEGYANLGYRSMWRLLNTHYNLTVTQETVRLCLRAIDSVSVESRRRHRLHRRSYFNSGPNYLIHIDGYDKLKSYGIAIHGAIDGYSRRILWLKAGPSNNNPRYIAKFYLNFVKESRRIPRVVRADAGTENVILRDLQIALRFNHGDAMSGLRSFSTGRSTGNQRIERLWRNLSESFTSFWRNKFAYLRDAEIFCTAEPLHIECIRYCFLPLIRRQLQEFMETWNEHRVRRQRQIQAHTGIPNVLYFQPQMFGTFDYSFPLQCSVETLDELAVEYSEEWPIRGCSEDFLELIRYFTGEEPALSLIPQNMNEALQNFCVLIYMCDSISGRI
ncbi:unnamed protein product [Mytilus edulis]|uniref:Integrase core domain-containing protein n=1 Tax=Mytilus edulis TaxID=6550 RepID=A0A8S3QJI7_MYTED|nr:unnamed protein product [Mytilus edulis]